MLLEYRRRIRALGFKRYVRKLLYLDFVGLIAVPLVVLTAAFLLWSNDALPTPLGCLWIATGIIVGRMLFQCEIGVFASDDSAVAVGMIAVPAITFAAWASGGFKPLYGEELGVLLGMVGALLSYLITWPLLCIGFCFAMFFPWMFIRGFRDEQQT